MSPVCGIFSYLYEFQCAKNINKKIEIKIDPPIKFFSLHGNGDTIRNGKEIQCLPYAGFFSSFFLLIKNIKKKKNPVIKKELIKDEEKNKKKTFSLKQLQNFKI